MPVSIWKMKAGDLRQKRQKRCRRWAGGLCLAVCAALCSCYTNLNQQIVEGDRVFSGYDLCYVGGMGGYPSLRPELYRCGGDWYIAALRCRVKARPSMPPLHSIVSDWYERHETVAVHDRVPDLVFHKLTPHMAMRLMNARSYLKETITDAMMEEDMRRAGGGWVAELPSRAESVELPLLAGRTAPAHWVLVGESSYHAPWYKSVAAGAVFVCVDVPSSVICSAAAAAGYAVASPVMLYRYLTGR